MVEACFLDQASRLKARGLSQFLLTFHAVMLLSLAGCVTRPVAAPAAAPQNLDIAEELKKSAAGWNLGYLDAFLAVYAENATFARQDNFVRGKPAIRALYAPVFEKGVARDSLALEQLEVDWITKEVALIKGIYTNMRDGKVTRRGTTTLLMRLIDGRWRIVHDHSS